MLHLPTGNWNDQKPSITGFTAPGNRYFGSRALAAQVEVTPNNWNDQKTKVTGYTAPSNKYFATRQRLAYHPEDKKFGSWINEVVKAEETKTEKPKPDVDAAAKAKADAAAKAEAAKKQTPEEKAKAAQEKKQAAAAAKAKAEYIAKMKEKGATLPKGFIADAEANTGH